MQDNLSVENASQGALHLTALRFYLDDHRRCFLVFSTQQRMDIVSSVGAVVGLVFNFATAIKTCNDIRGRYKDVDRTIGTIRHELETLQGALQELANLMMHDASALTSRWDTNKTLPGTFERALRGFKRTIKGLQDDLEPLRNNARLGKMDKVKLIWKDDAMKEHLGQLRAQSSALQLLLLVLQTGSISDVKNNLNNVEDAINQLSISSGGTGERRDETPPAYRNDVAGPSHILDQEEDLLDLDCSVVAPDQDISAAQAPSGIAENIENVFKISPQEASVGINNSGNDTTASRPTQKSTKEPVKMTDEAAKSLEVILPQRYNPRTSLPALIRAVYAGDVEEVKSLAAAGSDLEVRHPMNKTTAVMVAASLGDSEILAILLDSGASVTAEDRTYSTALHHAASEGMVDCVDLLLLHEAPTAVTDFRFEPPLHSAVGRGHGGTLKILLARQADPLQFKNCDKKKHLTRSCLKSKYHDCKSHT